MKITPHTGKKPRNIQQQLKELEAIAQHLGITIRYDVMTGMGLHRGGLCKLHGQWQLIVDRRLKESERIQIIADALRGFETEHLL